MSNESEQSDGSINEKETQATDRAHAKKALEAGAFVVFGFGMSQVIRLAGNIILTRLLVPELFGLITLARVFYMGLGQFSDIGLGPAIIRSNRVRDPSFLNTAWTIQVIRSIILAMLAAMIGYPVSIFYKEPALALIIPVIALISIPDGCRSTSLALLNRNLQQKKLMYMELVIQVISLSVMVVAAFFFRNVWALLLGELAGTVSRMIWSHSLNREQPNRLTLERESVVELLGFGKWILLSTAMMFLATQSDRILLGKLFTMTWVGVYSIAYNLAELPKQIVGRLNRTVIFPLLVKYSRLTNAELREKMRNPRKKLLIIIAALLAVFAGFSDIAIHVLYDQRYRAAAWILPMLALGMWPLILLSTIEGSLLAVGKPKYSAAGNFTKFLYMVTVLPLSYKMAGEFGAILTIALNDLPSYIVISIGLKKEGLSLIKQDISVTLLLVVCTAVILAFRWILGLGLPGSFPY